MTADEDEARDNMARLDWLVTGDVAPTGGIYIARHCRSFKSRYDYIAGEPWHPCPEHHVPTEWELVTAA